MRDGGIETSWRRRAQAAMDELRLVLPKFLPIDLGLTEFFQGVSEAFEQFAADTGERLGPPLSDTTDPLAQRDKLLVTIHQSLLELQKLPDLVPRDKRRNGSVLQLNCSVTVKRS
jgi:hypothetical protein